MFVRGVIQVAYIRKPLILPVGSVFVVWLADGSRFHTASAPDLFDPSGRPTAVTAELGAGSEVTIEADGRVMRAIQITRHAVANPFSAVAAGGRRLPVGSAPYDWNALLADYRVVGIAPNGIAVRRSGERGLPTILHRHVPPELLAAARRESKRVLATYRASSTTGTHQPALP